MILLLLVLTQASQARPGPEGSRIGPVANLFVASYGTPGSGRAWIGAPSLRAGVQYGLLHRDGAAYGLNVGLALQVGLESLRSELRGPRWGFGVTLRAGLDAISPGGAYVPFFHLYGLATLGLFGGPPAARVSPRFGAGVHLNPSTIAASGWATRGESVWTRGSWTPAIALWLAVLGPSLEFVVTTPAGMDPSTTWEVRLGVGL